MSDLKPCPHCGKVDTLEVVAAVDLLCDEDERDAYCHSDSFAVVCSAAKPDGPGGCGAQGGFMPTKPEAIEAWNRRAQPAQAVPLLSDEALLAMWAGDSPRPVLGSNKVLTYGRAIESLVRSKLGAGVPMEGEQISDGEFTPDAKLMELADKIDHEQNWRHSGIFQRDHLTQDQKDRVLAGVMLRRYADLMAPESWRLFPPKSVVSHSYRAATLEAVVKMAERHGIVGKEGGK